MDSEVYRQTQSQQLASSMAQYKTISDGYMRLTRVALNMPPEKRQEMLVTIENENKRLQEIVEKLLDMWNADKQKESEYSQYKMSELRQHLEEYKRQMEEFKSAQDELVKLQTLNQSIQSENKQDRTMYFGYIIACLVLLVLVFVMYVYTSFSGTSLPGLPELSSFSSPDALPDFPSLPSPDPFPDFAYNRINNNNNMFY
jgi:hypothetical protein